MKTKTRTSALQLLTAAVLLFAVTSCNKGANDLQSNVTNAAIESAQAIAVAASTTTAGDSIYVVQTCSRGSRRDSVSLASLPASVTAYLTTTYAGYTFTKAYSATTISGTPEGYIVVIAFNGNPVGLRFDATGNFVRVLEQREGGDLVGKGWHNGGRFERRSGHQKDTIAISQLSTAITAYIAANYPQDTLVAAFKNCDSGYAVISKNGNVFATVFNSSGTFVSRIQLPAGGGKLTQVAQAELPAAITSYLSTTYPNYVFSKAFVINKGSNQSYLVLVEANSTRYALEFNAAGTFVRVKPIR